MAEYTRPATLEDLKTLIRTLNDQGADYLLIGGYALFAHGYHRATTDINVLVPATKTELTVKPREVRSERIRPLVMNHEGAAIY